MTDYKTALIESMTMLAMDPKFRVVGYGLLDGKGANGTMKMVPNQKVVETTVCENLMTGMAQGLSMAGLKPLLYIERADFVFCCMDALVNHIDKCALISQNEFTPSVIIRVTIGNKLKPLFTGPTHTQNVAPVLRAALRMPVVELFDAYEVTEAYKEAKRRQDNNEGSMVLLEFKDKL